MNQPSIGKPKRYRLTLDFVVSINDELLHPYSDEDELDEEEKIALQAQRKLLQGLLEDNQGILEELIRKRILEETRFEAGYDDLKSMLLVRNQEDEQLVWPIIDKFSADEWNYFQEASEQENFNEAAGEAIYAISVDLEAASLTGIEEE